MSGDSYLESYSYENGFATIVLELDSIEKKVILQIKSKIMAFQVPKGNERAHRTCFLELIQIPFFLNVRNGIYVPSENFGSLMKEKRQNLNLAYGLKPESTKFILSLSADEKLASFVVEKQEDISFEFLNSE